MLHFRKNQRVPRQMLCLDRIRTQGNKIVEAGGCPLDFGGPLLDDYDNNECCWGAWIAEWYNTQPTSSECCTLGREFKPQ